MSFTLDLVVTELPRDDKEAWNYVEELREEYYNDDSGPHQKLVDLHEVLTQKYPCLCSYDDDDPSIDKSPWADGPLIGNFASKMGMVAITWPRVDDAAPFVIESAKRLGIIVMDGQGAKIHRPGESESALIKPWWKFW